MGDVAGFINGYFRARQVMSMLWGMFDPGYERKYGYHPPDLGSGGSGDSPPSGIGLAVAKKCRAEAQKAMPDGLDALELIGTSALADGGPALAVDDPRVLHVHKEWSECMLQRGFTYDSPADAVTRWGRGGPGKAKPIVSKEEIATAVADFACKKSTNLVGVCLAVQNAYDQRYIDAHRPELDARRARIADFLRHRT